LLPDLARRAGGPRCLLREAPARVPRKVTVSDPVAPPVPTMDEHSAPYWAALAERRILIQRCASCGRQRFPRLPACPYCGTPGGDDLEVAGTGTVYSFVRVHRAL